MDDNSYRVRVSEGRRVVLPAAACRELDIDVGDTVVVRVAGGDVRLQSLSSVVDRFRKKLRRKVPSSRSLVDELIAERRAEAARE